MDFASLLNNYKAAPKARDGNGDRKRKASERDEQYGAGRGSKSARRERERERVVYFVHTPKTAGSAIKHTLAKAESGGRSEFGEFFRLRTRDGTMLRIESRGHTEASRFPPGVFKFACVRHPYERFASAFSFVREGGRNHPLQGAVGQARKWQGFLGRFDSFGAFLRDGDAVRAITAPRGGHTHFLPLRRWICSPRGELDVDFVVRQEHLDEDFACLCSMLGLELEVPGGGGAAAGAGDGPAPAQSLALPKYNCTGSRYQVGDEDRPFLRQLLGEDVKLYEGVVAQAHSLRASASRKLLQLFGTAHGYVHGGATTAVPAAATSPPRALSAPTAARHKVFCIGGHKNGTLSLSCYFERLGFRVVHGCFWADDERLLASHDFFSDNFAEFDASRSKLPRLLEQYPGALFVLQYRPLLAYLRSLYSHLVLNRFRTPRRKWNIGTCGRRDILRRLVSTHDTHEYALELFRGDAAKGRLLVINVCNGDNGRNKRILDHFVFGSAGGGAAPAEGGGAADSARAAASTTGPRGAPPPPPPPPPGLQNIALERVPNYEKTAEVAAQMERYMRDDDTLRWVEQALPFSPAEYVAKLNKLYAEAAVAAGCSRHADGADSQR
eukprot:g1901.t1